MRTYDMHGTISRFAGRDAFLSNFHPSPILLDGIRYPTVEHAFQASKTNDVLERTRIAQAATPAEAKALGRQVSLARGWDVTKEGRMRELVRRKFEDRALAMRLLETGDAELIEGNTWGDEVWGAVWRDGAWHGGNLLGKILVEVRKEVRERKRTSRHWKAMVEVDFRDRSSIRPDRSSRYCMWIGAETASDAAALIEARHADMEEVLDYRVLELVEATAGDPEVIATWVD